MNECIQRLYNDRFVGSDRVFADDANLCSRSGLATSTTAAATANQNNIGRSQENGHEATASDTDSDVSRCCCLRNYDDKCFSASFQSTLNSTRGCGSLVRDWRRAHRCKTLAKFDVFQRWCKFALVVQIAACIDANIEHVCKNTIFLSVLHEEMAVPWTVRRDALARPRPDSTAAAPHPCSRVVPGGRSPLSMFFVSVHRHLAHLQTSF